MTVGILNRFFTRLLLLVYILYNGGFGIPRVVRDTEEENYPSYFTSFKSPWNYPYMNVRGMVN